MTFGQQLSNKIIERGSIFKSNIFNNIDHPKFFVIMGESPDEDVGYFFINSEICYTNKANPEYFKMQIPIKSSNYPEFLNHDSYIACQKIQKIKKVELKNCIQDNRAKFRGRLCEDDLNLVIKSVKSSDLFSEGERKKYFNDIDEK